MIESLAEHGVLAADLVPALMTTHTVRNPEYDPAAAKTIPEESEADGEGAKEQEITSDGPAQGEKIPPASGSRSSMSGVDPFGQMEDEEGAPPPPYEAPRLAKKDRSKNVNPFGDDSDLDDGDIGGPSHATPAVGKPAKGEKQPEYPQIEEGDIANTLEDLVLGGSGPDEPLSARPVEEVVSIPGGKAEPMPPENVAKPTNAAEVVQRGIREEGPKQSEALPGVSTALSKTDENVTLDIRWTVVSHFRIHDHLSVRRAHPP